MAATVRVRSHHTAGDDGGTAVDGTTVRFKVADDDTQNTSNQITRPGGGTTYSYIKQLTLYVSAAPVTSVTNVKAYVTGAAPTGVSLGVKTLATYTNPSAGGQGATQLTGTTSGYTYTVTTPLSVAGSFITGVDTTPKHSSDFILLQLGVASTASLGTAVSVGSVVLRYDEQ